MNKLTALAAGLLLAASSTVFAADTQKIGFIDGSQIIAKYESAIDKKLQVEFKETQDKLVALQKKLVEQNDRYKRDAATMSADEVKKLQASFEKDQAEFQKLNAEFSQKRAQRGNEELEKLLEEVRKGAQKVSEKQGYTIVLQKGAAIYVANPQSDITQAVLEQVAYQ